MRWASPSTTAVLPTPGGTGQHADDLVADLLRVGVEVQQDARGHALVLPHQAEQDVLGPDVVVPEREGLAERELQDLLRPWRERDLTGGDLLTGADDAHNLGAHTLNGDVKALEDAGGKALLLAQEAEQDVLGADVVVLQRPRLLLGEDDHLTGSFCESLEHGGRCASFLLSVCPSARSIWCSGRLEGCTPALPERQKYPALVSTYSAQEPRRMSRVGVG